MGLDIQISQVLKEGNKMKTIEDLRNQFNEKRKEVKMNEVITEIINQIGRQTFFMLGAKNMVYSNAENSFSFRMRGSKKANYLRIKYNEGTDAYDLHFSKIHGFKELNVTEFENVYTENLHEIIRDHTKLATHLPKVIFKTAS